ncbi:MAG TPA: DUF2235 domain-containing protein [Acidimicrobiia bacterium]
MSRNLVVCLDGTANEPEKTPTNVARTFDLAVKDPETQLAYYDPGVGTMGARNATSQVGLALTRIGGLAFGHGIKDNIAEAYQFLMNTYQPGDQIFIFGFSRGAYTARALAGLLRTVGLLDPGASNLIPYALKLYTGSPPQGASEERQERYWDKVQRWENTFGNPGFRRFGRPVHFLGVWDTVKFVGWFNLVGRFRQARWPFTRNVDAVATGRHALAIDERRRPYDAYRFGQAAVEDPERDLQEVWFAGVHSDVGGGVVDHRLSDIALKWMVDEAKAAGFQVRAAKYREHVGANPDERLPPEVLEGPTHPAGPIWALLGGWKPRVVSSGSLVHRSVEVRIKHPTLGYHPRLEPDVAFVD